ncbi:MAG: farnesyl diphosphate synthase [Pseudomonadota bacterium]
MTEEVACAAPDSVELAAAMTLWRERADAAIIARLPRPAGATRTLEEAMQHAVSAGGKRMRPALVLATGDALGAAPETLEAPAAAIEMVHAYSLVHDDLPAMDDDDLRRGQPTVHIKFDEATAVLAGDALHTQAFIVLSTDEHNPPAARIAMIASLAQAAGLGGMVGGQAIDLAAVSQQLSLPELQEMHKRKTGALIRSAVELGAIAAGADERTVRSLRHFSEALGLAFQIADDILDVTADTNTLGKRQGADAAHGKPTYCSELGLDGARREALRARDAAHAALDQLACPIPTLAALADYAVTRSH